MENCTVSCSVDIVNLSWIHLNSIELHCIIIFKNDKALIRFKITAITVFLGHHTVLSLFHAKLSTLLFSSLGNAPPLNPLSFFLPSALKLMHMLESRLNPEWQLLLPPILKRCCRQCPTTWAMERRVPLYQAAFCLVDYLVESCNRCS